MIYELKNKVPQNSSFIYAEDVLTSTVFGNIRYFKNQEILVNFLNEATDINDNYPKIEYENIFEIEFWKKYSSLNSSKINKPDLILLNKNYVILIECKYFSILNEENDIQYNKYHYNNQLLRYSTIINEYYQNRSNKMIIFLTNDNILPLDLLNKTVEKLDPQIKLYWLSWNKIYKTMRNHDINCLEINEKYLYNDLMEFLKKRNLTGFCGFDIDEIVFDRFYKRIYSFSKVKINNKAWRFKHE